MSTVTTSRVDIAAPTDDLLRRRRVLRVTPDVIVGVLARAQGPVAFEVTSGGVPDDAQVAEVRVEPGTNIVCLTLVSRAFSPVPEECEPPPFFNPPTHTRYYGTAYAERETEWNAAPLRDADGDVITPERWVPQDDECRCGACAVREPSPADLEALRRMDGT